MSQQPAYTSETPADRAGPRRVAAAKAGRQAAAAPAPTASPNGSAAPRQVLHHPEHPEVTTEYEFVTPTIAAHYDTLEPDWQRSESEKTTEQYIDDMDGDDWWFTGDSLKFTAAGELMDGRHRCKSIVESGKPQWMLVVRGLDAKVMRVLDTGYQRRFSNYLTTRKVPYTQSVGTLTGRILDWRRGNYATPSAARVANARHLGAKKSHQKLIHIFEDMRDEIITSVKHGKAIRANFPGSAPDTVFAFAYLYLSRLDPYKCAEFFQELTGEIAQKRSDADYPVRALEKTLTTRAGEPGIRDYTYLSWIFRAWNHWLADQPLSRDTFRSLKKPRYDWLAMPDDPNELAREEGWSAL